MDNLDGFINDVVTRCAAPYGIHNKEGIGKLKGKAKHRKLFREFVRFCMYQIKGEVFSRPKEEQEQWLLALMGTYETESYKVAMQRLEEAMADNAFNRWHEVFYQIPTEAEAKALMEKTSGLGTSPPPDRSIEETLSSD